MSGKVAEDVKVELFVLVFAVDTVDMRSGAE